jgi:hypothetical protein
MEYVVPPHTSDDIEKDLLNIETAVYLYVGSDSDQGWQNASAAWKVTPRLNVYLIRDRSQIAKWAGDLNPAGIVFGYSDQVFQRFNFAEAQDAQLLFDTIAAAMNP